MAEAIAGAVATATTSGVGAPWAIPLMLHGIDQVVAGAAQVVTGEQTHSRLEKIVGATAEAGGVSPQKAEVIGSVVDAVTGLALTAGVGSGQALTRAVATEAKVVNAVAKEVEVGKVVARTSAMAPASEFVRLEPRTLQSAQKIEDLVVKMKVGGWQGEPISVFEHNGTKYILDGHHRVAAARALGLEVPFQTIPASRITEFNYSSVDEILAHALEAGGR
jgi:hypothetical protein